MYDGALSFRIPAHWEDEYDDEGGGAFFDEDLEGGTLRANLMIATSKKPIGAAQAREHAVIEAEKQNGTATELGNDVWMAAYEQKVEEDGEDLIIYFWELFSVSPPNQLTIANFSFTMPEKSQHEGPFPEYLKVLQQEIPRTRFGTQKSE